MPGRGPLQVRVPEQELALEPPPEPVLALVLEQGRGPLQARPHRQRRRIPK
ncbi:MAG: hypothetical protein OXK79_11515 [Chloroflexota bacterium]|nr:hypothetical protein [Chloroflexota bacterium]